MPGYERWWIAGSVVAVALVLGLVLRILTQRYLTVWATRTATDLDDVVLRSLRNHLPWWPVLAGAAAAVRIARLPEEVITGVERVAMAGLIVSAAMVASNLLTGIVNRHALRAGASTATTSLARNVIRAGVLAMGGLLLLANLGVAITPLLTALGVGSLAVALALQPTLSNLFAGIHISVSRPIHVGDFIELENGRKGYVTDIGWRATRIRELPNNLIVIPNARVAEMTLVNYSMPEPEQAALVEVGVAYGSDLVRVEQVTCDVAREVLHDVAGGVGDFDPFVRYHTFGQSSIDFTVILRVRQFVDRYLVIHEFIKRLRTRFAEQGIEIPFPQHVVHVATERSADAGG